MNRDRTLKPTRRPLSDDAPGHDSEERSALLEAARGWAGAAQDALERLETDNAQRFLETARRNGPGQ